MITPEEILRKAERKMPEVLNAWLNDLEYFPMTIRSDKKLTEISFDSLHSELPILLQSSKSIKGYGYRVELQEVNTRKLGKQKLPAAIMFEDKADFWRYLGKEKEWQNFQLDVALIRMGLPTLQDWLQRNSMQVIGNHGKWPVLIKICQWIIANPQPQCYLREIPEQPHTKFVEENKGIIESLLNGLVNEYVRKEGRTFEERFSFKTYDRLLEIRLLDPQLAEYFSGVSHLGITIPTLAGLQIPCRRVIVMENKASYSNIENVLTLPQLKDTIVIFGSGYAVSDLKQIPWLKDIEIYYWGDIDAQGFEMLSAVRGIFPQTHSVLMDRVVYDAFGHLHSTGTKSNISTLFHLTREETILHQYLKSLPDNNRLEQERIPHEYVLESFRRIFF